MDAALRRRAGRHADRLCALGAHLVGSSPPPPRKEDEMAELLASVAEHGRLRRAHRAALEGAQERLADAGGALAALSQDVGQRGRLQSSARVVASELQDLLRLDRRTADATERLEEQVAVLRSERARAHRALARRRAEHNSAHCPMVQMLEELGGLPGWGGTQRSTVLRLLGFRRLHLCRGVCRAFRSWVDIALAELPHVLVVAGIKALAQPDFEEGQVEVDLEEELDELDPEDEDADAFGSSLDADGGDWLEQDGGDSSETFGFALDLKQMSWQPLALDEPPLFAYGGLKFIDGMLVVAVGSAEAPPRYSAPAAVGVGFDSWDDEAEAEAAEAGRARWPAWLDRAGNFAPMCTVQAGRVLVVGGNSWALDAQRSERESSGVIDITATEREQDRFDDSLAPPDLVGAWAPARMDDMIVVRAGCAAGVMHDGSLLVAGGDELEGGAESSSAERYEPGLNRWTSLPPMQEARGQCRGCVTAAGCFVVSGGRGRNAVPLRSVEVFKPAAGDLRKEEWCGGVWHCLPPMTFSRIHHTTCNLGNDVLVMGGRQGAWGDQQSDLNDEAATSIELWDDEMGRWFVLPATLPTLLSAMVATPY
jgi:hypothetical protein